MQTTRPNRLKHSGAVHASPTRPSEVLDGRAPKKGCRPSRTSSRAVRDRCEKRDDDDGGKPGTPTRAFRRRRGLDSTTLLVALFRRVQRYSNFSTSCQLLSHLAQPSSLSLKYAAVAPVPTVPNPLWLRIKLTKLHLILMRRTWSLLQEQDYFHLQPPNLNPRAKGALPHSLPTPCSRDALAVERRGA